MSGLRTLLVLLLLVVCAQGEMGMKRLQSFLDCTKFTATKAQDICASLNEHLNMLADFAQRYDSNPPPEFSNITSVVYDLGQKITNVTLNPLLLTTLPVPNRRPSGFFYKAQACAIIWKSRGAIGLTEQMMLDAAADCKELGRQVNVWNAAGKELLAYIYPGLTGKFPFKRVGSDEIIPQMDDLLLEGLKLRGRLEYLLMQPNVPADLITDVQTDLDAIRAARQFIAKSTRISDFLKKCPGFSGPPTCFPELVDKLFDLTENQRLEGLATTYPQLLQAIMSRS